jgi:hypothetical protein
MRTLRIFRGLAVAMAAVNLLLPQLSLQAASPAATPSSTTGIPVDVGLDTNGRLTGQVLDGQGRPLANEPVAIQSINGPMKLQTTTDAQGRFLVDSISAGTFQILSRNGCTICRCWTSKAAPPSAQKEVLVVSGNPVERGQKPISEFFYSTPVLFGLIVAAAIAIPIAIHNSKDDSAS